MPRFFAKQRAGTGMHVARSSIAQQKNPHRPGPSRICNCDTRVVEGVRWFPLRLLI